MPKSMFASTSCLMIGSGSSLGASFIQKDRITGWMPSAETYHSKRYIFPDNWSISRDFEVGDRKGDLQSANLPEISSGSFQWGPWCGWAGRQGKYRDACAQNTSTFQHDC